MPSPEQFHVSVKAEVREKVKAWAREHGISLRKALELILEARDWTPPPRKPVKQPQLVLNALDAIDHAVLHGLESWTTQACLERRLAWAKRSVVDASLTRLYEAGLVERTGGRWVMYRRKRVVTMEALGRLRRKVNGQWSPAP